MLDRLERADRHAELLALLRVVEGDVEDGLRGADDLERVGDRDLLRAANDGGGAATVQPRAVEEHAVEGDVADGPRGVERADRVISTWAAGTDRDGEIVVEPKDDGELVGVERAEHVALRPGQPPAVTVGGRGGGNGLGPQQPAVVGEADGPRAEPAATAATLAVGRRARSMGTYEHIVGDSAPGATTRPSSSAMTASSTTPSPMPPSSSGTHSAGQSRPTACLPQLVAEVARLVAHDVVDVRAQPRRRALLDQHVADRVAERLLVGREVELHAPVVVGPGRRQRGRRSRPRPAAS